MFEREFHFLRNSSIRSKALCLGIAKPTTCVAAKSTAHGLRHEVSKQKFVKENGKIICVKEVWKICGTY